MFREMRLSKKQMDTDGALEIVKKGDYGVLATYGENGYPYAVPVNYAYDNGCIYFHCAMEGHKLDNIRYNSKVSFCVVGDFHFEPAKFSTKYESVVVFGEAVEVDEEVEKRFALLKLVEKHSADFIEGGKKYIDNDVAITGILKIRIEDIKGKRSL